tara:strand:+ start:16524 stop:17234 length:711 start_codon:yes stop_codon:yes gene_type:complete
MNSQYESQFVERLFDKMSASYSKMNYISSFGFSERWRKKCVKEIDFTKSKIVVDLLTGMGECWKYIDREVNKDATIIGLDFSKEMIKQAKNNALKFKQRKIEVLKENVFENSIKTNSADVIISGFGLKTFNEKQLIKLGEEVKRMLKVGGKFSFIDVSVPNNKLLKFSYVFYLKNIIPVLGKIFLGNPEVYRMLGVYTAEFKNAKNIEVIFKDLNFEVEYVEYFFGCASGIKGYKK